jgi:hypothetical protein
MFKNTWNSSLILKLSGDSRAGILEGGYTPITDIIPYTSAYYQRKIYGSDRTFKAGLDIKYSLMAPLPLDAILVPDFGQTKFDNAILNLLPFEQRLTDLFLPKD